mgnify:CR=1 FL=1
MLFRSAADDADAANSAVIFANRIVEAADLAVNDVITKLERAKAASLGTPKHWKRTRIRG